MDVIEEKPQAIEKPIAALAARFTWLAALPILGFICYATPYVAGLAYRQTYLGKFNVPETLFKSEARDYFVYAYSAVLEILGNWTTFITNPTVWFSMIGVIVLFFVEVLCLIKLSNTSFAKSVAETLGRNRYVALVTGVLSFSTAITALLLLIPLIILPFIVVPAIVGTYGANRTLDRDLAIYDKGCDHSDSQKNDCHVIMDGTKIIATGFLVTTSDTRVVIYEDHKAKIFPIKDYSIELLPPQDYLALVAAKKIPGPTDVDVPRS